MKFVIFLCALCVLSGECFSQLDSCKLNFLKAMALYTAAKDSLNIYKDGNIKLKQADSISKSEINHLTLAIKEKDSQLELFKQSEGINLEPAIKWQGFYINIVANYAIDSTIISQTFINHFKYALSLDANISIMQKFRLAGELEIPLTRVLSGAEGPIIKLKAGWRIF